jgi:asparagine synthase (glutamine-hydrolysing)
MCGIAGSVGGAPVGETELGRMAGAMAERGPDDQGVWADGRCGLAFRRLAIIDLDRRSSQPMHLDGLHLVFNGEIYNYRELRTELEGHGDRFRTAGDAEVLLHAWRRWGQGALERFNGMFAFAIWDEREAKLSLASDPFGEKPVYWARGSGGALVFASEIEAILLDRDVRAAADERILAAYLAHNAPPPIERSFFAGIDRLPGGHVLEWRDGHTRVERWWRPRQVGAPSTYQEAVEAVRELLLDSIRLRLRSDVPVGTSLSGGVDSSGAVGLSAQLAGDHRRHAFTATFPGFERDEWAYASLAAQAAGVDRHHAVEPNADDALNDLERLIVAHEEPVASLSVYAQWRVNAAAKEAGVVVLLDGQGGDELFGGYPFASGYALRSTGAPAALRAMLRSPGRAGRGMVRSFAADHLPAAMRARHYRRSASPYVERELARDGSLGETPATEGWMHEGSPLRRELVAETFVTSLPGLLRYADRSSMAHSREVRLPLLDRRLTELALSLPASFLVRGGMTKAVLRDAVREVVPTTVLARRDKVGFEPPQAQWLETPAFRSRIAEVLLDPQSRHRGLYASSVIETDVRAGRWRDNAAIWRALNAELWLRLMVAAPGSSAQRVLSASTGR